ncbi:amylo-alpha-1,6-glucosidase [Olivibacter sp. XZL3]|uniref:amylo-alpha-1,6-glucosidase n=1 Tax=Olivibacter sp. XZL3 TaxID=1735116 RepID=UPI0010663B0E|nr:amylo-alpha-1,6-glucosidase [Olivibacter sp. XZL3]
MESYEEKFRVLNHCDTFAILNRWGNIDPNGNQVQGIYNRDTRFINNLALRLNGIPLDLLSSSVTEENEALSTDLSNPVLKSSNGTEIPAASLHIHRSQFLKDEVFHEKLDLRSYLNFSCAVNLSLLIQGDFADIFEVRGAKRKQRGKLLPLTKGEDGQLVICYEGLDLITRKAIIYFSQPFEVDLKNYEVRFPLELTAKGAYQLEYAIHFEQTGRATQPKTAFIAAKDELAPQLQNRNAYFPVVETSNEQFTHWLNRSQADLVSLMAETPYGKYPYAGVPWYNTAFGRDGIITAWQTLWLAPQLAKDVLLFLAAHQATQEDHASDAEPGKILHEIRNGEMVALNELPFKHYYGTIDATPLFIMLAGAYFQRTNDRETIKDLWPHINAAIEWMDRYGDLDGDGFVEYEHKAEKGLTNQGWKDSFDAVSHVDGTLAKWPIALCEVQGYVYAAKLSASNIARELGYMELSKKLQASASSLRTNFNERFWIEEKQCFALALDGDKKPCAVKSSNAGHVLFTGIAYEHLVPKLIKTLLHPNLFAGWGIRTLAADEVQYNPMSYHNGSIWPHDVALIAAGFAQYGFVREAAQLATALFDASLFIPLQRLPELFCGFDRRQGEGPTAYPVACSPQAWSVSSVFLLLQSLLGIEILPEQKTIYFRNSYLPSYLDWVKIKGLQAQDLRIDLEILRHKDSEHISVNWRNQPKDWKMVIATF